MTRKKNLKETDMKPIKSDRQLSIEADKKSNFLAVVKSTNIKKYNYLKKTGIRQFLKKTNDLSNDIASMYYELIEERRITDFYKDHMTHIFSSTQSFATGISNIAFTVRRHDMDFNAFIKWKKVIKIYNKHKKEYLND